MTQVIDPTMWPKVEGPTVPSAGVYWCVNRQTENVDISRAFECGSLYNDKNFTLYGPIEFAKPSPPPDQTLYLVKHNNCQEWCVKYGDYLYSATTYADRGFLKNATVIRTATLKEVKQ